MTPDTTKELFPIAETQKQTMQLVDLNAVKYVKSLRDAFSASISISGNTHESIAENKNVRKRKEQISKFISGSSGLKGNDFENVINETGNLMVIQYLASKYGFVLVDAKAYAAMRSDFIEKLQSMGIAA